MKKKFNYIILILISTIVLYFSLKDNAVETIGELKNMNILFVLLAVIFVSFCWIFRSLSLYIFTKKFKSNFKYTSALKLTLTTLFFDGVTPFSSGGQPFQVYYLKKHDLPVVDGTNIIIQNFIVYQIALVFLGVVAIISNRIFNIFPQVGLLQKLVTIGFIINLLVTIGLFSIAFLKKFNKFICKVVIGILFKLKVIKSKEETLDKFNTNVSNFNKGAKELLKNKKLFIKGITYNFMALICFYTIPVIILFAMNDFTSFNLLLSIVASAYVMLIGSFVPIPGGSGGLEYGFVAFFGNFLQGSKLTAIMLIWRFITYYLGMIVGAIAMNIKEKSE